MVNSNFHSSDGSAQPSMNVPPAAGDAFYDSIPLVADMSDHPDSGYRSYAESVTSTETGQLGSVLSDASNHCYENGRRYHGWRHGRYPHPNDAKESDREDMKHHATMLQTGGRLFLAPITANPQKVLDVGTGTGIWAIEFATKYPSAKVIGVDLSPIQPAMVPANLEFEVDDIELPWTYGSNTFDYIHVRYMFSGTRDWPQLLEECINALKPGGYVEMIEMDIKSTSDDQTIPENYQVEEFCQLMRQAGLRVGFDYDIASKFKGLLETAGFTNVTQEKLKLPMGPWPKDPLQKELGMYQREQFLHGLPAIGNRLLMKLDGWTVPKIEELFKKVRAQVKDDRIHCYWKTYFVYGQKPIL